MHHGQDVDEMKTRKTRKQNAPGTTIEDDALYDKFVRAMCSVPEGRVAQALDTIEGVLRRAVRDLGPQATLPEMQSPLPASLLAARPLLDALVGHPVADGARIILGVHSAVAQKIEATGGARTRETVVIGTDHGTGSAA
jgi:hypothetical protein